MFDQRLKQLRRERGLTQDQLARIVGVTPLTVSLWERGQRAPNLRSGRLLAEALGCSLDALYGSVELADPEYLDEIRAEEAQDVSEKAP